MKGVLSPVKEDLLYVLAGLAIAAGFVAFMVWLAENYPVT